MLERFVAIDNVCSWPNLGLMKDGTIIATIFNQPTHGGWEGDVECWASVDAGRTWRLRGVPAPHEPGTNRMNVAAGPGYDGALVTLSTGWSRRTPPGQFTDPHKGEVLPIWVCRSMDGGRTWAHRESVEPLKGAPVLIPFGNVLQLRSGALGACLYAWTPTRERSAHFYVSHDNGETWKHRGLMCASNSGEPAAVQLADGRMLAAVRTMDDQHLELYASHDEGASWQPRGAVTLPMQHPANLLQLADGRVLLSYGIRNKGLYGVGIRLSSDGGGTWGPPEVLVKFEGATDGGYPSSVQVGDGTIVTAYYANCDSGHHRYHTGIVRWSPA